MFIRRFFAPALVGFLFLVPADAPAWADESLEDLSAAFDNLDELVDSVGRVGGSLGRVVQPRQYHYGWQDEGDRDDDAERPRRPRSHDDDDHEDDD